MNELSTEEFNKAFQELIEAGYIKEVGQNDDGETVYKQVKSTEDKD